MNEITVKPPINKGNLFHYLKNRSPGALIALGFLFTILLGSALLMLPCCIKPGVSLHYIDALYTSTSAVCVTGLVMVDLADTFTWMGQALVTFLIQVGGLGVTAVGAGIILVIGKKVSFRGRNLLREAMNLDTRQGIVIFLKKIFITTFCLELTGALLSFCSFSQYHPPLHAIGISVFHSIAAFNNAGFDILGGFRNMIPYQNDIFLNIVTMLLVFTGGIGFLVLQELKHRRFKWHTISMHSKIVLSMSIALIIVGALLLKCTEDISWLAAFFHSVVARTAGFSSYAIGDFTNAGLLTLVILMFIGASPGSTGGGIKTSTFFILLHGIKGFTMNRSQRAFHYTIPDAAFRKASIVTFMALFVIVTATFLMSVMEPHIPFLDLLFETTSAFATVGLSTGITPELSSGSKIISILVMYIGRLGPLTIASMAYSAHKATVHYPEGHIMVG